MTKDPLKDSLDSIFGKAPEDPTGTVKILIDETLAYRDRLKEDSDYTLTVEDTRLALDALQAYVTGKQFDGTLDDTQKALLAVWIEKLSNLG